MRRGFGSAVVVAVVLAVTVAAPAHAAKPQITPYEFSGEGVFLEDCPGGYDILIEFAGRGLNKVFVDQNGKCCSHLGLGQGLRDADQQRRPDQDGDRVEPNVWEWDFRNMTFTIRGMSFHNNIPGEGRVAHDAGVLVFELLSYDFATGDFETGELLHSGGKHPGFENIDWCSMVD